MMELILFLKVFIILIGLIITKEFTHFVQFFIEELK